MTELPGAVSLARALMTLARSRRTGVLEVFGDADRCRVAIANGTPRAITAAADADYTLGDVLVNAGQLDGPAHQQAMAAGAATRPVGAWLVAIGAASGPAVAYALRAQLKKRIERMFHWRGLEYRFVSGRAEVGVPLIEEPIATADLVLGAMRRMVLNHPVEQIRRQAGTDTLRLTRFGVSLLGEAALWPDETAMVSLLKKGSDVETVSRITHDSHRAMRTLHALCLLGAVAPASSGRMQYSLLLSKQRQVRRAASAAALLELPDSCRPEQARKALRRLTLQLHPDRLGPNAPPAVRQASLEVMRALVRAESEIRKAN